MINDGTLTTAGGGLVSNTGTWNVTLGWSVNYDDIDTFTYSYTVTTSSQGDISHFLLEVSSNFASTDVLPGSSSISGPGTQTAGGSNPDLPGSLNAVKFDFGGDPAVYTLVTKRIPVWGDVYGKDGSTGGPQGVIRAFWNAGFGNPDSDPTVGPFDTTITDHVLVPDTGTFFPSGNGVPEPATCLVLMGGLVGIAKGRRRRRV